ncbi:MAG: T9SS type A sorting domain-containing protein [bacterium]|nr:T9SS type A sorting domain-containing protein [bacterium]
MFSSAVPLTAGSIETFTLSHPWCSDVVTWTVGDSSGEVDGPLPVELLSFTAIPAENGIRLSFSTASETDNDRFEILRGERVEGEFTRIVTLPSQGNSATEQRYEYTDTDVNPGQTYWYYLADVDMSGNRSEHRGMIVSATALDPVAAPSTYSLSVYPNPFNPSTTISFTLAEAGAVRVAVYDVRGRWIQTLADEERNAGGHKFAFDARELPSGVYFVRMESGEFQGTRKVVLMR